MANSRRGLIDVSLVIDHDVVASPATRRIIAAIPLGRLDAGPYATTDEREHARRQDGLHCAAATWDSLPFDTEASRQYGRIVFAMAAADWSGCTRVADLLIAATVAAYGLPPYTRRDADFSGIGEIVKVFAVWWYGTHSDEPVGGNAPGLGQRGSTTTSQRE